MIYKYSLKLLVIILLLTVNLCSCKHYPRRRRFTQNLDNLYIYQPLQPHSEVDVSSRVFPWRHRVSDIYTNADTVNIDDEPYRTIARKRRRTHDDNVDMMTDRSGPTSIHNRVNAIRRKVQLENDEQSKCRSKRSHEDIDRKLDSLVYRYRLKRSDGLLRKQEFNTKAAIDERMSQDVNRMLAKIKEETRNEMYVRREPMKKREECDKAERRLNFLLSLKSCDHN